MSTVTATIFGAVDLARSLADVRAFLRRFVVLSPQQATTLALWIVHTHTIEAFDCTPYLQISSATKRAGKTRLLEVLEPLVARAWFTGRVSAAALVRKVDSETPTLLLDESDAAFGGEKEYAEALRGVLNTGYRRSGKATLCVAQGNNFTVRDYKTYGAKAIAGIGQLPGTIADRAIPIVLQRRATGETCERWRERDGHAEAAPLLEGLVSVVAGLVDDLREARPVLPGNLSDRQQDVWEPLLAIADFAGGAWPTEARAAAHTLSGTVDENDIAIELLSDLRDILDAYTPTSDDVLATKDLVAKLVTFDDRPWAAWRHDKPITGKALAGLLKRFLIVPTTTGQRRGYRRDAFEPAFARYLPFKASTRHNVNSDGPESPISMRHNNGRGDTLKSEEHPIDTGLEDTLTLESRDTKAGSLGRLRFD